MARTQEKYSEARRAEALAHFEACGNQSKTSRECGIPVSTVRTWVNGTKMNDDVREKIIAKKADLADRIEELAHLLVNAAPGKILDASLQQTMTSLGIAVDKLQLLRNKPTEIVNDVSLNDKSRVARIAELLDRGRTGRTGSPAEPGT